MIRFPFLPVIATGEDLFGIMLFVLAVFFIVRALRSHSDSRRARRALDPDSPAAPSEEETLRRLCEMLDKMERRLNNLETILMDKNETKRP